MVIQPTNRAPKSPIKGLSMTNQSDTLATKGPCVSISLISRILSPTFQKKSRSRGRATGDNNRGHRTDLPMGAEGTFRNASGIGLAEQRRLLQRPVRLFDYQVKN